MCAGLGKESCIDGIILDHATTEITEKVRIDAYGLGSRESRIQTDIVGLDEAERNNVIILYQYEKIKGRHEELQYDFNTTPEITGYGKSKALAMRQFCWMWIQTIRRMSDTTSTSIYRIRRVPRNSLPHCHCLCRLRPLEIVVPL